MIKSIYKYQITNGRVYGEADDKSGRWPVKMPVGAEILTCMLQRGFITIWAIVDTEAAQEERVFGVSGTGFVIPDSLSADQHIATVMTEAGLVWHVFETKP